MSNHKSFGISFKNKLKNRLDKWNSWKITNKLLTYHQGCGVIIEMPFLGPFYVPFLSSNPPMASS